MANRIVHFAQSGAPPSDLIQRFAHLGIGQPALCRKGYDIVLRHSFDGHPPPESRKPILDLEKRQIAAEHYGKQPSSDMRATTRLYPIRCRRAYYAGSGFGLVDDQQAIDPDSLSNLFPQPPQAAVVRSAYVQRFHLLGRRTQRGIICAFDRRMPKGILSDAVREVHQRLGFSRAWCGRDQGNRSAELRTAQLYRPQSVLCAFRYGDAASHPGPRPRLGK
ncbi:hypothetical protein [Paenirhodobacter sp.]|uniref:hypothetical protein n=1 Tax=Paenirhodobacter sp. TaxID=1965326 RepID=UPI003B5140C7